MSSSWIETFTGRAVTPLKMAADQINIEDIAHSLALQCRYTGHCQEFYSVAQHCTIIAITILREFDDPEWAICGLLHDASEAYLSDIASPIKPHLLNYLAIETECMKAVTKRFKLIDPMPAIVKIADKVCLRTEQRDLMTKDWGHSPDSMYSFEIEPQDWQAAEEDFLHMFDHLNKLRRKK